MIAKEKQRKDLVRLLERDEVGLKVLGTMNDFGHAYHLDRDSRTLEVSDKMRTRVLHFAKLQDYIKNPANDRDHILTPINVKDHIYGGELYFGLIFRKNGRKISDFTMGIGIDNGDRNNNNPRYLTEIVIGLDSWADGKICIDEKARATLFFFGGECFPVEYCARGIAKRLYRNVLRNFEQKEGEIHHIGSGFSGQVSRIIDWGS